MLYLDHSEITEIKEGAFEKLPNLKKINLSDTENLKILRSFTFNNLQNLQEVRIDVSGITEIEEKAFTNLPKLEVISFWGSKNLKIIDPGAFHNLPLLKKIDLEGTGLTQRRKLQKYFKKKAKIID